MKQEYFPDGTQIESWFYEDAAPSLERFGKRYYITDYGIEDDGNVYTEKLQSLIDNVYENGGGVIVVPCGKYITGALFFRSGVDLCIEKDGILMGSDNISDYPVCTTRIEGETCKYFPALINADGVDGFTIFGDGTIDGNGRRSWEAFWLRRKWNPECTNKDEQRPRLIYVSNSTNVTLFGLRLQNSHFWTNHFYKCRYVRVIDCDVFSPAKPIGAPSTDAIDIDVCTDVLIKRCRFEVNDDAVALKGGKGPFADTLPENGANERVLIEDCEYGFCHSCLTCGSEAVHNKNIILRNSNVDGPVNVLNLKMRIDTPQRYEYISVEGINGSVVNFLSVGGWSQFFDLKGRKDIPLSYASNVTMSDCKISCDKYFNAVANDEIYILSDFAFKNLNITAKNDSYGENAVRNIYTENVSIKKLS